MVWWQSHYYRVIKRAMLPVKWMAPECLESKTFSNASDIWALGIVLWEIMALCKTPYKKLKNTTVAQQVYNGYRLELPKNCPDDVYQLMRDCWEQNPQVCSRRTCPAMYSCYSFRHGTHVCIVASYHLIHAQ